MATMQKLSEISTYNIEYRGELYFADTYMTNKGLAKIRVFLKGEPVFDFKVISDLENMIFDNFINTQQNFRQ